MQVSRLEIKGFKSFGDRVVINFDEGITGIVGPNGCGKSNVVDAIRWVLGEQKTRNLRSDKMENVIFNGSKTRKPVQMAEVSITFDNNRGVLPTEYSQVTVTRRYHRSGDSEYLLNGVPCRLKDINELFLDTGIGSDSYAIIELKMVDEILNDKENSRRLLFEEAAGISKFRVRKKQTLKKLEETDADLERVEDVLFEIGKNMKTLERQAKQAIKYFQLKEDYKKHSLEFARRNISQYQQTMERLEQDVQRETALKEDYVGAVTKAEDAIADQKEELNRTQEQLSEMQKTMQVQTAKLRQLENDIKLKAERGTYLKERITQLRQQISQDSSNVEHIQESIGQLRDELEAVQEQFGTAEEQVQALKEQLQDANEQKQTLQDSFQYLSLQHRDKQNAVFQHHKQLEISNVQIQSIVSDLDRMEQQQLTADEDAQLLAEQLLEAQELLENTTSELVSLQAKEETLLQNIEKTELDIEALKEQLVDLNRTRDAKQNQYNLTKSLVENMEGFPEAIKFLAQSGDWQKPAPLLSDIIVCEPEYKGLIESYLEPYMNFFVVDDLQDALDAVELLKSQNKGRANFIILSEIEELEPTGTYSEGDLKAAYEVVKADKKYSELLKYMLNNVYISDDVDLYDTDYKTILLKDGSAIKKPLSLSGGSVGVLDGNRLGRKQNLETLAKEVEELIRQTDILQSRVNAQQQILLNYKGESQKERIKELERETAKQQQELLTIRIKHEQHQQNRHNYTQKKEELLQRKDELSRLFLEMSPVAETDQQELKRLEEELAVYTSQLNRQQEQIAVINGMYNQENIQFHQLKNRFASLQQEISYKQKTVETNQERIEGLKQEMAKAEEEITIANTFIEENEAIVDQMTEARREFGYELEEIEKKYFTLRGELDEKDKTIRELQRKRQNADELLMRMQQALNDTKIKLVSVQERLAVEFNIETTDLQLPADETIEMPTEELSNYISGIRSTIDKMGPVNAMAAEAYGEIEERNNFITTQRNDLVNAKNTLIETINEIDTVAKEKFLESFNEIKGNFIRVFRSLFTDEDNCDLVITDPSNPLDSKIEIMAQPKGKRPLTINQLSGGEKTLTAISLLFAIYLLKPAPFCIFDEVDAPLDDANIDKFNNIIRTFSNESQFIVVTHNKRTMASTDVMYGITMIEAGISRVIPVDLRQIA
ncbi:chromosome segregation protein SMC [Pontibacter sp. BT310]|uniref:Chromosome partition protein Smc n=1 Tax=Pontibacter populi TaxID=890055 RepID=A0ABS6XFZ0_9BACT|nr:MULTISPECIES: chromosome segregation protein SMC [Pontibacter]MBJ6119974.1 chromosome segregation protein SMC [Pontibacter sp. BT310]MBR0572403.1 chromosome segregation protein SMC [Microvirga sp. STS03]MBW3366827.1 chromosome segregation protein SMC [Pontibacter populi]